MKPTPHVAGTLCERLACETLPEKHDVASANAGKSAESAAEAAPQCVGDGNISTATAQEFPPLGAPFFETHAGETLREVAAIFSQRGSEYEDSWALSNMHAPFLRSILRDCGLRSLTAEEIRLVMLASLVDVKDQRMGGPWKDDSVVDGVAYRSALLAARRRYKPPLPPTKVSGERDLAREGACEDC